MPAGLSTSPCLSRWTMVASDIARPAYPVPVRPGLDPPARPDRRPAPRRRPGGGRKRVGDAGQGGLVVRRGQEPGLERRRRQVDAAVEHGVEERGVGRGATGLGVGEVAHRRRPAQEHREQVPRLVQPERHPGRGQRRGGQLGHGGGGLVDPRVHLGRAGRAAWPARPRSPAGYRTACRPGRPARPGRARHDLGPRRRTRRPGSPPPITLPNVIRSPATPSTAVPAGRRSPGTRSAPRP